MTSADVENSDVALVEELEMLAQEMGRIMRSAAPSTRITASAKKRSA